MELDIDYTKELMHVMQYLNDTKHLPLTMDANGGINAVEWWIDTSYGVYPDMKSYIGCTTTLQKGYTHVLVDNLH